MKTVHIAQYLAKYHLPLFNVFKAVRSAEYIHKENERRHARAALDVALPVGLRLQFQRGTYEGNAGSGLLFSNGRTQNAPDNYGGARESVAAHGLHRPTRQRPASATNRDSRRGVGVGDRSKGSAKVTGNSAPTEVTHPSWALGPDSTEAASGWRGRTPPGHPAAALGETK